MSEYKPVIRKSRKAKNLIIKVTSDSRVLVTVPYGVSNYLVDDFIKRKSEWIKDKLEIFKSNKNEIEIKTGNKITMQDREYLIEVIHTRIEKVKIFLDNSKILIFANKHHSHQTIKESLIKALKREFKKKIEEGVDKINTNRQFKFNRIAIKDNRSNWGSCSTKGNLNFNWRLLFAPKAVLEYVIIHELCHLKEHNHSASFWDLVKNYCPDYKVYKNWLKQNGHTLNI